VKVRSLLLKGLWQSYKNFSLLQVNLFINIYYKILEQVLLDIILFFYNKCFFYAIAILKKLIERRFFQFEKKKILPK